MEESEQKHFLPSRAYYFRILRVKKTDNFRAILFDMKNRMPHHQAPAKGYGQDIEMLTDYFEDLIEREHPKTVSFNHTPWHDAIVELTLGK